MRINDFFPSLRQNPRFSVNTVVGEGVYELKMKYRFPSLKFDFFPPALLRWALLCLAAMGLSACDWFSSKDIIRPPYYQFERAQVEAALKAMSIEQKVSQMLILKTAGPDTSGQVQADVAAGLLGGIAAYGLEMTSLTEWLNTLDARAPYPLLRVTLESCLLNNQVSDATPFPSTPTLAAAASDNDHDNMRRLLRLQTAITGINCIPAPRLFPGVVWDAGSGLPKSSVELPLKYVREQSKEGMLQIVPVFSHLVYIEKDTAGLLSKILAPYRQLAKAGAAGFWIDPHILKQDVSRNELRDYFENNLQFDGLLAGEGDLELLALAGADLIVYEGDISEARAVLLRLVEERQISMSHLDNRVRRILSAKFWSEKLRETARPQILKDSLTTVQPLLRFRSEDLEYQAGRLWRESPVVLHQAREVLPLPPVSVRGISLNDTLSAEMWSALGRYAGIDTVINLAGASTNLTAALDSFRLNIVLWDSNLSMLETDSAWWQVLNAAAGRVVVAHFGDPARLILADTGVAVVHLMERNTYTEKAAAFVLAGAQAATAVLPDSAGMYLPAGAGHRLPQVRLRPASPRETGIHPQKLVGIDAIANNAIDKKLMPGCQVLIAKNGQIIYSKAFGQHDYKSGRAVSRESVYDIASITKVAATTLNIMRLKDEGKLDETDLVKEFISNTGSANGKITLRQLLTHTSGLPPTLPIGPYLKPITGRRTSCNVYFCKTRRKNYEVEVAEGLYFKNQLRTGLIRKLYQLPVSRAKTVRYSDVNMVILQQIAERADGRNLDAQTREAFFEPLGLQHIGYRPRRLFPLSEIVPTENDTRWRRQVLHGHVHDPAAALLGGVAGHAGLFSSAEDLAVIFQMLLNEGSYGGKQYLKPATVKLFTSKDAKSKRGLGFDKPRRLKYPTFSSQMSATAYGHTGFTGTCAWADPEEQMIFIFLCNRIHPTSSNNSFITSKIRKRIHDVTYDALGSYEPGWGL